MNLSNFTLYYANHKFFSSIFRVILWGLFHKGAEAAKKNNARTIENTRHVLIWVITRSTTELSRLTRRLFYLTADLTFTPGFRLVAVNNPNPM